MTPTTGGRVFVGVDSSLCCLRALRLAAVEARHRGTELHVVHVRRPIRGRGWQAAAVGVAVPAVPPVSEARYLDREADALIVTSLEQAFGGTPHGVTVRRRVLTGPVAVALCEVARRDHDLLVISTGGGWRWRDPLRRSISGWCVKHARCPVLVVPPDQFTRTVRRARLPRHPWAEFDAVTARAHQRA